MRRIKAYRELPLPVTELCEAFVDGLKEIVHENLYGIYMYGASVFPDSGKIQDIDCHVILKESPRDQGKDDISQLFQDLSDRFPLLGGELDTYFILYEDARKTTLPNHQLRPEIRDESWALHCSHIRAGCYISLYGPEPTDIFPDASWNEISAALDSELEFIKKNLSYPDYCVLNLCRIIHSVQERNVVVSKRFAGCWACARFPQWKPLIEAATRSYDGTTTSKDNNLLNTEIEHFLEFASESIDSFR